VKTRTYEEIYDDIAKVTYDPTGDAEPGSPEFSLAWAVYRERHAELWGEIARMASRDGSPGWATLAVALLRDEYARQARDAREDAERRKRP
jgi:hypothetical protein